MSLARGWMKRAQIYRPPCLQVALPKALSVWLPPLHHLCLCQRQKDRPMRTQRLLPLSPACRLECWWCCGWKQILQEGRRPPLREARQARQAPALFPHRPLRFALPLLEPLLPPLPVLLSHWWSQICSR